MRAEIFIIQRFAGVDATAFKTGPDEKHGLIVVTGHALTLPAAP